MKNVITATCALLLSFCSIAQTATNKTMTGSIVMNERFTNGEGEATLLINKQKYTYHFQKLGESRMVKVVNNKNEVVATSMKVVGKTEYYIIGQEILSQDEKAGKSIQLLSRSYMDKIFTNPKNSPVKKEYMFYTPDPSKENYFSFYRAPGGNSNTGSVSKEKSSFAAAMCSGHLCLNSLCECFKQTLCALGQCLDNYAAGEVSGCNEEVKQVQACGGYGGKVQVIKKSITRSPISN